MNPDSNNAELIEQAREIVNRHAEYMDGVDRGQRFMRMSHVLAAVQEALASRPIPAHVDARDDEQRARELLAARGLVSDASMESDTITLRAAIKAMIDFAALSPSSAVREALERIARPRDCGCRPCVGQCTSIEALLIELDAMRDIARAALSPLGEEGNQ